MSKKPQPKKTALDNMHARFDGQLIAGGCEDCDAYQTLDKSAPGIFAVTVHHDDTCPFYRQRTK